MTPLDLPLLLALVAAAASGALAAGSALALTGARRLSDADRARRRALACAAYWRDRASRPPLPSPPRARPRDDRQRDDRQRDDPKGVYLDPGTAPHAIGRLWRGAPASDGRSRLAS